MLVCRYSAWIWEQRVSPSRLRRAWEVVRDRVHCRPSWAGARGPIASTLLTLMRIGWGMLTPTVLTDDLGRQVDLMITCPLDVQRFLVEGIHRWQSKRIIAYLEDAEGQTCWLRAVRKSVLAIKSSARRGALRALWAAAIWTPQRLHSIGKCDSPDCFACKRAVGTLAHQWFDCPSLLQGDPESDSALVPDDILEAREAIKNQHASVQGVECFFLSYGVPPCPPFPPDVEPTLEIF
eukprot:1796304-Pyramimonas_sp.AAC.1